MAPRSAIPRRLVVALVLLVALLIGAGAIGGALLNDRRRRRPDHGRMMAGDVPWLAIFVVIAVVAVGLAVLVWRRLSRPMSALLGAAARVGSAPPAGGPAIPVAPVPIPAGTPRELRALIVSFNDMTARLDRADAERRRFLADVTHELRTPLTVLRSGIEAQLDGVHPRDDAHLGVLREETVVLGRLIDDLHTLALTDAGRLALHRVPTDVAVLARDVVAGFVPMADAGGVELRVEGSAVAVAEVDPGRLRQVLGNLLANAIRHTPAGGHVRLVVDGQPAVVRLDVVDDGPGFPPAGLAHVFTRHRRATDSGGSGLGLTIAHDLVTAHGGSIEARNGPDGGAWILVQLPAR